MAWELTPQTDLVLQLHLLPTGRPEPIRPRVAFYFSDDPPRQRPYVILLRNDEIDIPPGETRYRVEDSLTLPVEVDVLGIYPHAHYLGKEVRCFATLPDGSRRWLIRIDDWDFNWQDDYRYEQPLRLPAGSTLTMEHVFDNSAANVRNPHVPPRRVRFGNRSSDEMATMTVQVLARDEEQRMVLEEATLRQKGTKNPGDWNSLYNLGTALQNRGRSDEAEPLLRRAIGLNPGYAPAHNNLGNTLDDLGRLPEAIGHYREATTLRADYALAHNNLGTALARSGRIEESIEQLTIAVALEPDYHDARSNLGLMLQASGRRDEALSHYRFITPRISLQTTMPRAW